MMERDDRWDWVALDLVPGVGPGRLVQLAARFGGPRKVFEDPGRAEGFDVSVMGAIRRFDRSRAIRDQQARAKGVGASLILQTDPEYPPLLATIGSPPPYLFVRGTLRKEDALAVAVVGSRHPTPYGVMSAERLGGDLARRGVTVVSGFARGIDTAAHRGALASGGRTIAVLGCGADIVYPKENGALMKEVALKGAIISQYPLGTPPLPEYFPVRNQTIAGMTLGTVVVEAAEKSGSLITAKFAGELGREVFAVPGNISSAVSHGTNCLIQDGAKLVRGWQDVVEELPPPFRQLVRTDREPPAAEPVKVDGDANRLLALLGDDPVLMDQVIRESRLTPAQASAILLDLELRGLVRQLPGQRYVKVSHG